MADIQLSQNAEQDIKDIYLYTARMFGQRQADAYVADLLSAAKSAASFPLIGRNYTTRSGRSYRRYECGRHTLFYRIVDSGIFVVRIPHGRGPSPLMMAGGRRNCLSQMFQPNSDLR